MDYKTIAKGLLFYTGIIATITLLCIFLFDIKVIFSYIVFASILTLIGKPIALFLQNKLKFNAMFATITTMVLFVGIAFSIVLIFVPLFINQGDSLSFLNYNYLQTNSMKLIDEAYILLHEKGISTDGLYSSKELLSKINFDFIPSFLNSILSIFAGLSIGLLATLFITFYLIKENNVLERFILGITPTKHHQQITNSATSIKKFLSRYFIGLFVQISILFVIYAITLSALDIPNAIAIAFLCSLLNLIPYVGPLIGIVLMLSLSLIGLIGQDFETVILPAGLYIALWYGVAQLFDNFISQPLIFSKSAKSHPLEIFIVILISGILFGIIGMMVAVPLYTAIKVIAKEFFPTNRIVQFFTKNL